MGLLELISTAHMSACEEQHPQFARSGSLRQCTFAAQPCIAQWIGEHPKWADMVDPGVPLPTPWDKAEFEKHSRDIQTRRRKLRAENRP